MYNYPTIGTGVCDRVSSVFVASNDLNYQMEVGWLASPEDNVCGATTDAARLLTAVTDPGIPAGSGNPNNPAGFWCPTNGTVESGVYKEYAISDPSENGAWRFTYANSTYRTYSDTSILAGNNLSNGERHFTADTAAANFDDLQYDSGGTWIDWSGTGTYTDGGKLGDPDYSNNIVSNIHVEVVFDG